MSDDIDLDSPAAHDTMFGRKEALRLSVVRCPIREKPHILLRVADRIGLDQLGRSRQRNPRSDFRRSSSTARALRLIECYPSTLHRPNEAHNRYNRNCSRPWLCPFCSCRLYTKAVLERLMDVLLFKGCSRRESRIVGATWLVDPMIPRQQLYNIGFKMLGSSTFMMRADRNKI